MSIAHGVTPADLREGVLSREEFLIALGLGDVKCRDITPALVWERVWFHGRAVYIQLFTRYFGDRESLKRNRRDKGKRRLRAVSYTIKRTDQQIDEQLNRANAWEEQGGTAVRGMTYEQGVKQGIEWITGGYSDLPIETEPEE